MTTECLEWNYGGKIRGSRSAWELVGPLPFPASSFLGSFLESSRLMAEKEAGLTRLVIMLELLLLCWQRLQLDSRVRELFSLLGSP